MCHRAVDRLLVGLGELRPAQLLSNRHRGWGWIGAIKGCLLGAVSVKVEKRKYDTQGEFGRNSKDRQGLHSSS